jgi:transcriptional regulator with GAF, ATPase, and Fis domain
LVLVDCTTISPHLSGSEFFGHERGAFTGAHAARDGAFALANKGSLFLDEVGELPLPLQAELLRVIQERTYKRVGGNQWQRTEFRLICATNRDLRAEVSRGRFRADLYYRLATWTFTLPPLRQRREDILPLAEHFIGAACPDDTPQLSGAVKKYLANREFRGNVRELRLLMARILSRHTGPGQISIGAIPQDDRPVCDAADEQKSAHSYHGLLSNAIQLALQMGSSLKEIGREAEAIAVQQVLQEEGGNLPRAAQRLQVTARALQIREARKRQDGNGRYDAVGEEEI